MAKYIGRRCAASRREKADLELTSGIRPIETKCKFGELPGQRKQARSTARTGYALQLREKQKARRIYGVLERQFRNYYHEAAGRKGSTGVILLQLLESRLDNVVYRLGFARTRAEARQLVSHCAVQVNGSKVNIASYRVKPGDVVSIKESSKSQARIQESIQLAEQKTRVDWIDVDTKKLEGTFKSIPDTTSLMAAINVSLIVELYSK